MATNIGTHGYLCLYINPNIVFSQCCSIYTATYPVCSMGASWILHILRAFVYSNIAVILLEYILFCKFITAISISLGAYKRTHRASTLAHNYEIKEPYYTKSSSLYCTHAMWSDKIGSGLCTP